MPDRYLDLVRASVPRPDLEQTRRFARLVVTDHSWYKKLPMFGVGEPFILYLAPHHRQLYVAREDGTPGGWRDIVEDESTPAGPFREFLVDYMPGDVEEEFDLPLRVAVSSTTGRYRERYGHWSYWNHVTAGSVDAQIDHAVSTLTVTDHHNEQVSLSRDAVEAGLVHLNALAHPAFTTSRLGSEYEVLRGVDPSLPDVEEERRRQLDEVVATLERTVALIWPAR